MFKYFLTSALALLAVILSMGAALADAQIFPPANVDLGTPVTCPPGEERFISWLNGASSTYCRTPQGVLHLAIPDCQEGQYVILENGSFICKAIQNPPECAADEFLSYVTGAYVCRRTGLPPVCNADEVLTYTPSGFICVDTSQPLPTCGANQFRTYNGSQFQCASVTVPAIPTCGADEVITANGSQLYCKRTAQPSLPGLSRDLPFQTDHVEYIDCPADYVAIACTSVVVPSGNFSCRITPGQTNPATGLSACAQAGCNSHQPDDTAYYSTATCMKLADE